MMIVGYAPRGDLHMLDDIPVWIYLLMRMVSLICLRRFYVDDYLMDGCLRYLVSSYECITWFIFTYGLDERWS